MGDASVSARGRRSIETLDPATMADALLLTLDRGQLTTFDITPIAGGHRVRGGRAGHEVVLADLPRELGDALVARITLLAGLDPIASEEQLGRIRTCQPDRPAPVEHLVAVRTTAGGRALQARVIVADGSAVARTDGRSSRSLGTYLLGEEVGRGGMGIVYRGEHLTLQKPVAIKVLHHGVVRSDDAAARLVMEARAACRCRHPVMVDVSDVGRLPDGRTFLVMELVEAPTLEAVLEGGPLAVERVLHIAEQVTSALQAASDAGVVHCDIKPANLFLLADDRVKITDFGVARVLAQSGHPSTSTPGAGTAWYMSPEQAAGAPTDARSDLYSLGVVMFELLTGRVPFDAVSTPDILAAHRSQPVPPMVGPEGLIRPEVEAIVRRALEKARDARFRTPAEMSQALEHASRALKEPGDRP
jgi:eukaryotic-like serine/threonine-protein kinase